MKIGILTYHRAHNYGALLQAYALQNYLLELGHHAEVIDYWPKYHAEDYKLIPNFHAKSITGKIESIVHLILGYSRILSRSNKYKQFIREHFNLSDKPRYIYADSINYSEYDVVVYGSDQIWRNHNYPLFKGFDKAYFGSYPFIAQKRISYAASMGVINLRDEELAFLKRMMENFDAISVRESELKQVLEVISDREISLVLDPVFLLEKGKWMAIIPERKKPEKYILLYQLVSSVESIKLTNSLQEYYGCKVIEIRGRVNPLLYDSRYKQTVSPLEFITLILYAEFIISTSFHGAAFSVIFEKQFYAIGMGNNSGRVLSLLSSLGIENRYLENIEDANFKEVIDYPKVNKKLRENRVNSISFLKHALYGEEL